MLKSEPCPNGWRDSSSRVPNPWVALDARPELNLLRAAIPEPARYYDDQRCIVIRKGLLLVEERRYLWHELVHADRRDRACHTNLGSERSVEREAARRALPLVALRWAFGQEIERHRIADILKLPEDWIQFRLKIMTSAERKVIRQLQAELLEGEVA